MVIYDSSIIRKYTGLSRSHLELVPSRDQDDLITKNKARHMIYDISYVVYTVYYIPYIINRIYNMNHVFIFTLSMTDHFG